MQAFLLFACFCSYSTGISLSTPVPVAYDSTRAPFTAPAFTTTTNAPTYVPNTILQPVDFETHVSPVRTVADATRLLSIMETSRVDMSRNDDTPVVQGYLIVPTPPQTFTEKVLYDDSDPFNQGPQVTTFTDVKDDFLRLPYNPLRVLSRHTKYGGDPAALANPPYLPTSIPLPLPPSPLQRHRYKSLGVTSHAAAAAAAAAPPTVDTPPPDETDVNGNPLSLMDKPYALVSRIVSLDGP